MTAAGRAGLQGGALILFRLGDRHGEIIGRALKRTVTLERSASKWNHQALRASFPRKRESSVVERRSGNMDARFRGHDTDLGSTKMQNALMPGGICDERSCSGEARRRPFSGEEGARAARETKRQMVVSPWCAGGVAVAQRPPQFGVIW
jgi:hypothetical protein